MREFADADSISVVMATYNAAPWIRDALDSVLGQTYPVDEVIVVDDGSTDKTVAISREYPAIVRVVEEVHRGRPHRNRGVQVSHGSLVAFIDADDRWRPTKLERQVARLRALRAEWVACAADWLDMATGRQIQGTAEALLEGDILEALFLHNFIVASTAVVSRRVLEEMGGFDESADIAAVEDWDLWLRVAGKYPLAVVREPLAEVRLHEDSFLASRPLDHRAASLEHVINTAAAREPLRLGGQRHLALHRAYFGVGVSAFRRGLRAQARRYFGQAWRNNRRDAAALAYIGISWMPAYLSDFAVRLKRRVTGKS